MKWANHKKTSVTWSQPSMEYSKLKKKFLEDRRIMVNMKPEEEMGLKGWGTVHEWILRYSCIEGRIFGILFHSRMTTESVNTLDNSVWKKWTR